MDLEAAELLRERAVSSAEPCSTRPNPFNNDEEHSSRKRQRVSSRGSRSRSVDAVGSPTTTEEGTEGAGSDSSPPRTPTRVSSNKTPIEPTSSRVTINLRSARTLETLISSPPLPESPLKMAGQNAGTQNSGGSGSDPVSTKVPALTPSPSSSALGSPEIEVIPENEDSEFTNQDLSVAIIDDDDDLLLDGDPIRLFPYNDVGESLPSTVRKISRFFEFGKLVPLSWPPPVNIVRKC
jgi:ubiquitin carboxyl-terminal hydrolase 34